MIGLILDELPERELLEEFRLVELREEVLYELRYDPDKYDL